MWLTSALSWYLLLAALGIIFYPVTRLLFARFPDRGWAFSKTIGILIVSYSAFFVGSVKLVPFTKLSLYAIAGGFMVVNYAIYKKMRPHKKDEHLHLRPLIIFEEILFVLSFLFLIFVRGQEPSLNSLEKFMDFGFMNSILRSSYFPPLDIWYSADPAAPAGYPINYYYFGHLTGSVLIKLSGTVPAVGYNLVLAAIFAQAMTMVFSLVVASMSLYQGAVAKTKKVAFIGLFVYGLIGAYLINLGGNLHTLYLFTKGYPNETPIPFWKILSSFSPSTYWYPNATRFIPYTIHEFPSYSWVVADLHGHVFNIPFVLLMIALLMVFFISLQSIRNKKLLATNYLLFATILGFMIAVHYMTNAFDGPIYFLLTAVLMWQALGISRLFFTGVTVTLASFMVFSLPFTSSFTPFVSGIGLNCSLPFLTRLGRIGPFLFEKDKCQISPLWMLLTLWGFFLIAAIVFALVKRLDHTSSPKPPMAGLSRSLDGFYATLFVFGFFLLFIPEFFYVKDIYPAHFRANTMFKLGYQAFILMGIASIFTLYRLHHLTQKKLATLLKVVLLLPLFLVFLYPFFSFPSYYGHLNKTPQLDGSSWLTAHPEDKEIIDYLNLKVTGQPVILEAQGDSYTQYERVSAYTGLPTVAGWWVHEWLWRGSADIVGRRIPDVVAIYESQDVGTTRRLLQKYRVSYVVVSRLEREKYKKLNHAKFDKIGRRVFESTNGFGALYKVD